MRDIEGIRPFKLVKYFAYTSFILIFISTLVLSFIVSRGGKSLLLKKSEEYAHLVAGNLNHQVYLQFTIPTYLRFGKIRLREKAQFELLDKIVRNTIHGFDIQQVNIYDLNGVIAYSTNPSVVGKKGNVSKEFELAKQGRIASQLIVHELKTYIPFRAEKPLSQKTEWVLGIFEIIQNLSRDYKMISHFQYTVIGSALIVMTLLFVGLTFIVRRADKIIEHRARETRQLEEQLHRAEHLAALGQMVAAVSHEIRNPLGIIRSTAEMLKKRMSENKAHAQLSEIIVDEANRLNRILTEFLEFARPQPPKFTNCNITEVLDKVLNYLKPEFDKHNIELIKQHQDSTVIHADPDLLYRAFLNILINAIQAMPQGGRLIVNNRFDKENRQVSIEFFDSGPGIPENVLKKVFNPFFTTKEKGSGLGLSIVKNIIENHGGKIKIESKQGEGTKVVFLLRA